MTVSSSHPLEIPAEQRAIREKCFHPSGTFIEFQKTAIEQSIPSRFEEQVRRNPKRLAIKTGREELTYDELNNAANRVAEAILAHRGKESKPIALLFEQGAQGIAAILGALKAGKTYVPADPSIPRTRTTYILEDSQADLIVTNRQNLAMARELAQNDRQLLNIDELGSSITAGNPGLSISPDSVAWIIYTSGSTGQPKGVAQTHRCVLHMIFNYTNSLHICPDDSLSLLFSLSVHAGTFGAFLPLLTGAGLYAIDLKTQGIAGLADWLVQQQITVYCSVPTVFRQYTDTLTEGANFPNLRLIYLAGEPVYKRDAEQYRKHFPQECIFVNRLGCTEADVISMYFVDKETPISGNTVLCGFAPQDKQVMVIGEDGHEVGINQTGEIAVRSRYLSPGYWRSPELSKASFLPDPDGGDQRIYLIGDLGRMLPDGCQQCPAI